MALVPDDPQQGLLERATVALEGVERTFERQAKSFDRQQQSFERQQQSFERMQESFERTIRRSERSENAFIVAISDIAANIQRNTDRLDDMGEAIRANTQAVLSMLDRLGPAPG